jgi:eukaryotic-like serine/threonine-protein kinase
MPLLDWDRVQSVFLAVADLPPPDRAHFLDTVCAGDPELRDEVESLLQSDLKRGKTIRTAVRSEASLLFDSRTLIGDRLGAYRIVKEIGRGGMGAVYLAVRDDDQYQKQVAIKVIKRGMDTDEVLGRFRHERQILANLDHAYIGRLIDGGSTPGGQPFLVMEFVEGQPIDQYCRDRHLTLHDRCKLFLKTCEAVSHAHRNLVVHRDLKPENILITPDGAPKLLDFGVAKILQSDTDRGSTATIGHSRPLTPDYASPEQILGQAVSTATDVYSLGVIFHELLSGAKPYRIDRSHPGDWERIICEEEIARPSDSASDDRMRKHLRGDLDNIVLMAMRKEANRRYASVDQFAEDIHRFLDCLPILARKDSWRYRTLKFTRRHRFTLVAATAVVASLVAGTVIAFSQARQADAARKVAEIHRESADRARIAAEAEHKIAEQQRDVAVRERVLSEERLTQMVGLSDRSLAEVYSLMERLPGALPARRELLGTTLEFLEKLSRESSPDPRLRIALATAYLRLGDLQGNHDVASFGDMESALKSYRGGARLLDPEHEPTAPAGLLVWVDLQAAIGKILTEKGDLSGATAILLKAIRVAQSATPTSPADPSPADPSPANKELLRRTAGLYLLLARRDDDLRQSLAYANDYLHSIEALSRQFPKDRDIQGDLSLAYTEIGWQLVSLGDPQAGIAYHATSLKLREQLARDHPNDLFFRRYLMLAYEHYATVQGSPLVPNLGRPDIARQFYAKAQVLEDQSLADPQNHMAEADYAAHLLRLGTLDPKPGELEDSLANLRQAARLFESLAVDTPGVPHYDRDLSVTYEFIGDRYLAMGKTAEAIAEYRKTLAIGEKIVQQYPEDWVELGRVVNTERSLSLALQTSADSPALLEQTRRLISSAERASRNRAGSAFLRSAVARAYLTAATLYRGFDDWNRARDAAQRAMVTLRESHREGTPDAVLFHEAETLISQSTTQMHGRQ